MMGKWMDAYAEWPTSLQFGFSCLVLLGCLASLWAAGYAALIAFRGWPKKS